MFTDESHSRSTHLFLPYNSQITTQYGGGGAVNEGSDFSHEIKMFKFVYLFHNGPSEFLLASY